MRRFSLGLIATVALTLFPISLAHAQSQPGCAPAPAGASSIVCFGTTPCPAGYIDPVGGGQRGALYNSIGMFQQNPLVPQSAQRWLCQLQTAIQENSGISKANGAITGPAASGTGSAVALPLTVSTTASTSTSASAPQTSTSSTTTITSTTANPPAAVVPPAPATTVVVGSTTALGSFLTTAQGMTLYERNLDSAGASTCTGSCSLIFPPFAPPAASLTLPLNAAGPLAVITRDDGTQQ
ncbi:MAG TPA: hypothetical protein VK821_00005, partial [Dehalococcoidia bacterium]|nr:hypothetical protein [Dehalococcoidia bacterium]